MLKSFVEGLKPDHSLAAGTSIADRRREKLPASTRIAIALAGIGTQLPAQMIDDVMANQVAWQKYESGVGTKPQPQKQITVPGVTGLFLQAYYTGALRWLDRYMNPLTGKKTCSILGAFPEMSLARAAAAHFKLRDDLAQGVLPGIGDRMTLDQAVTEQVFPNSERNGKKSLRSDRSRYPKHIKRMWGDKRLSELREPVIRQGIEEIRRVESPANAEKHVAFAKSIFRDLAILKLIARNPAADIKMIQVENPVLVIPSDDQLAKLGQALLAEPATVFSDFILTAIVTGGRQGELRHALVSDLDIERRVLTVRETKSGRVETLQLCDVALTVLTRRKALATSRYLFGSPSGGPLGDPGHAFQKFSKRAGVSGLTLHAFRRGFATACIQVPGVTAHDASKLLTHSSVRVTEKFYLVAPNSRLQYAAGEAGRSLARRLGLDPLGRPFLKPSIRSLAMSDEVRFVAA
ncbi:site-specific integrase [Propionivibrio sp.]|uniref:tyrosine-type recombinase/integrase n=1 Tax=Propionivibrio sp. TaxID=2212460 RepID=UPI00262EF801|nr:site-specific integrase [Propionivibrio sp.]